MILLDNGLDAPPALAEETMYLPFETLSLLLDAGVDPNCNGFASLI